MSPSSVRPDPRRSSRVLVSACLLALVALGLMVWSLYDPRPFPVIVAMSLGQVFGTLSLGAFLVVVLRDVRRLRREAAQVRKEAAVSARR